MKELRIAALKECLNQVLDFVNEELDQLDCSPKARMLIDIAVEEMFVNIASYAYGPEEGDAEILLRSDPAENEVEIEMRDSGVPFDPLQKPDPDVTLPASQRKIGGLGIFMVKKSMDSMTYEYRDGQNRLSFRKKLD